MGQGQKPWTSKTLKIILIIAIVLVGAPVVIPVGIGIVAAVLGLVIAAFAVFASLVDWNSRNRSSCTWNRGSSWIPISDDNGWCRIDYVGTWSGGNGCNCKIVYGYVSSNISNFC